VIRKVLRRLAGCTVGNLVYALASVLPRDERLWLFGAWNGRKYLDNPKYIYEFVLADFPDVRAVWICKDSGLHRTLLAAGRPAVLAWSPRGIWYQLRASVVVFTHSASWEFAACLLGHRVKRVQTWHGIPIKKIGYDDQRFGDARRKARLTTLVSWYEDDRCDLVLAASETEAQKLAGAFNVRAADVRITGYPRNDAIVGVASC
jgi:CDP-glycerol glycerophosphotransferase (TagB/SpsB family)